MEQSADVAHEPACAKKKSFAPLRAVTDTRQSKEMDNWRNVIAAVWSVFKF